MVGMALTGAATAECRHVFVRNQQTSALANQMIMLGESQSVHAHVTFAPMVPLNQPLNFGIAPSSGAGRMLKDGSLASFHLVFIQPATKPDVHATL